MPMPIAIHPLPSAEPWVARAWARIKAVAGAGARPSAERPAAQRWQADDEALSGLSEHMLKDIGASSRLIASAASRSRDGCASAFDPGQY